MCLAVPGKITELVHGDSATPTGKVSFGGVLKEVNLTFVPEAGVGDYVVVHAGFALNQLDEAEAQQVFEYVKQMDELAER